MAYQANSLNVYETYTYNISLHMVHPRDCNRFDLRNGTTILMADNSQDPRYIITDVEQDFRVGHSQVRNTFGNRFTMRITEPNGTTFLEKIALAARQLGIENHLQAKYYIAIEFNGRLPNGQARKHPNKFIYAVSIQDIQMQITAGGAEYTLTIVENSSSAFNYLEQVIRSQITIECNTVGEFMQIFQERWAKSLDNELLMNINALFADQYIIEFDSETGTDEWLTWPIQEANERFPQGPNRIDDKLQFTIPNGSNLSDVIGMALMATAEYKRIITATNGFMKPEPSEPAQLDLSNFPVFYKVVPKIEFGDYDPLRGDYVKIITFKVKKHIVADRIMDAVQYTDSITNSTIQNSRVQNLMSQNLLRKRYDYIFTGLNTEIINLDLKLDHQFYEISVIGNGQVGDPNTQASRAGNSAPTVHDAINSLKAQIVERSTQITRLQRQRDAGEIDADDANEQIEELTEQRTEIQAQLDVQAQRFADLFGDRNPPANGSFLTADEASSAISMPVRFAGDIVDDSDVYGPESDTQGGTLQFGAVKTNLENSADMLRIELAVRGDPYWMGQPNSFFRSTIGQSLELADYEAGGLNFFLNVRFPSPENGTGRRIPRDDYTLSGVYRVQKVINRFSGGTFIQYLDAVRDLATNTATVLSTLQQPIEQTSGAISTDSSGTQQRTTTDPAALQETNEVS